MIVNGIMQNNRSQLQKKHNYSDSSALLVATLY